MPTTSTSSTTSTTLGEVCGNNKKEGKEECDDGDPLSETDCCNANCRYRASTTVCGAAPVGPCAKASTCNGLGDCVPHVKDADSFECRPTGTLDDCDLGDSCDGVSPDCPGTHSGAGCKGETPDTVRKPVISVKCEALLPPEQSGEESCEASGTDASAELSSGGDAAAVSLGLVTENIRKTLKKLKNGTYQRVLKLHLNAVGKRVLRERGKLPVRVTITINHGRAHGHQVSKLVTVEKKKKP